MKWRRFNSGCNAVISSSSRLFLLAISDTGSDKGTWRKRSCLYDVGINDCRVLPCTPAGQRHAEVPLARRDRTLPHVSHDSLWELLQIMLYIYSRGKRETNTSGRCDSAEERKALERAPEPGAFGGCGCGLRLLRALKVFRRIWAHACVGRGRGEPRRVAECVEEGVARVSVQRVPHGGRVHAYTGHATEA
jgi:hypothetical protein